MNTVIPGHKRTKKTVKIMARLLREMEITLAELKRTKPHAPPSNEFVFAYLVGASHLAEAIDDENLADELTVAIVAYCDGLKGADHDTTKH